MIKRAEWFTILNYFTIILICMVMVYPFLNVAAVSFSSYSAYVNNPLMIWPQEFNVLAYKEIMGDPQLWRSYANTVIITVGGVAISILLYILTAYPLSKKGLRGRRILMMLVIFTMLFNGGLIPNFYLIRSLGMLDTLGALVVPMLISGFNLILMKSFFESLPEELEEAARIDGASDPYILFRIIVPLSKPIIATLCLFTAVAYWNNFFNAIIYIRSDDKWPLMLYLREVIEGASALADSANTAELGSQPLTSETIKYATLILVMIPILAVYPFLQRYFVKGIMLGSVKG